MKFPSFRSREKEQVQNIPSPSVLSQSPTTSTMYPATVPTPLVQALDSLLNSPSIPLDFRKQFFILWENVIFGNYSELDMKYLMSKFREWTIQMLWYIPEQEWGNVLSYQDTDIDTPLVLDYNLLFNTLEQLYYINLTRGKGGFTVKEMNTSRFRSEKEAEEELKRTIRLF